jgi:hypothetical protein
MSSCFILPFRHKSGCEVYVVHGISLLNGFHFFIKVRGSPLFHIALNPRTLRDLCAWKHKDILALKHKRYLAGLDMPQGQVHRETYMCNLPPSKKMLA